MSPKFPSSFRPLFVMTEFSIHLFFLGINRHLIADHLGWFKNLTEEGTHVTIEQLAKLQGQKISRGRMDAADPSVLEYSGEEDAAQQPQQQEDPSQTSPSSNGSPKS